MDMASSWRSAFVNCGSISRHQTKTLGAWFRAGSLRREFWFQLRRCGGASEVGRFWRITMRREHKYVASLFLSAAMVAPLGAMAMPKPQDDHERHEREEREHRMYDPVYRDYHNWDAREDEAYHRWLEQRHESYVEFDRLDRRRQEGYWRWRHKHEEH